MMIEGEGADVIPRTSENFVVLGVEMVFRKFDMEVLPFYIPVPWQNGAEKA